MDTLTLDLSKDEIRDVRDTIYNRLVYLKRHLLRTVKRDDLRNYRAMTQGEFDRLFSSYYKMLEAESIKLDRTTILHDIEDEAVNIFPYQNLFD